MKFINFYRVTLARCFPALLMVFACQQRSTLNVEQAGSFAAEEGTGIDSLKDPIDSAPNTMGSTLDPASDPNEWQLGQVNPKAWPQASLSKSSNLSSMLCQQGNVKGRFVAYTNANMDPLRSRFATATRAIIVLHGARRDASVQLSAVLGAIAAHPETVSPVDTLVVAPWYLSSTSQIPSNSSIKKPLYWSGESYMEGGESSGPVALSSFVLVDSLLQAFADREAFPKLTTVSIVGHSAGGQTSQRYAMAGSLATVPAGAAYSLQYGIANPSSYAYLDARRSRDGTNIFALPSDTSCTTYDKWKYGLQQIPSGMTAMATVDRVNAYLGRAVTYALGTSDNDPADSSMDSGCEATLQGNTRLKRGRLFYSLLKDIDPKTGHILCEVPGVAHDTSEMLMSSCMTKVMFR